MTQGFDTALAAAPQPLTDCPLCNAQRFGDARLGPSLLMQFPSDHAAGFSLVIRLGRLLPCH